MKIRNEITKILDDFIFMRRAFHKIPEIGFETFQTMGLVEKMIGKVADEKDSFSGVFYLKGSEDHCVAFRSELDGLPILEKNTHDFVSTNGCMHACGHDAHMAILIATYHYFVMFPSKISLLFIFQPAEESGNGANYIIKKNIFEKYHVKALFATHLMPFLGDVIGSKKGWMMAESCEINITIQGKAAHCGHPEKGVDACKAMTFFLQDVYELEKEILPHRIHFGKVNSGEIRNGMSAFSYLEGTLRCFDSYILKILKEELKEKLNQLDKKMNTISQITFSLGYQGVINDETLVDLVENCAEDSYREVDAMMLSEDFSSYQRVCATCLMLCGLTSEIDLHDPCFDFDESECLKAIEMNVRLVEKLCEIM